MRILLILASLMGFSFPTAAAEPPALTTTETAVVRALQCLAAEALLFDDGVSDAATIARAVADYCEAERQELVNAVARAHGGGPLARRAAQQAMEEQKQDMALDAVLLARKVVRTSEN